MGHRVAVFFAALVLLPAVAAGQDAGNVLLVINRADPASLAVGAHYAAARHLDDRNIVRIQAPTSEVIGRPEFASTIEAPIAAWLARQRLQDQILYIVLTKGVPIRIAGTEGRMGTGASVDSELTLLYRKMTGAPVSVIGRADNPYFLGERPMTDARRFTRESSDLYLVTRLDGFTVDDVLEMIDRSTRTTTDGAIVLDQRAGAASAAGDGWLTEAARRLEAMNEGARVAMDTTRALAMTKGPVLGYFSWGSNDPANQLRRTGLTFANGAIGGLFVSTDGRTFIEPPPSWRPAVAGSTTGGQSLAADLIRDGLTGVSAHVAEPLLDAIIRPQILFPAYLSGFNLAESFYLAMPFLSWQDLVIGDPLCAPFARDRSGEGGWRTGIDAETDLPRFFAERSLKRFDGSGLDAGAIKLSLKAFSAQAQDKPGAEAEALLRDATRLEPRLAVAHLGLAQIAEKNGDAAEAVARYEAVLKVQPENVVALNNSAFLLADRLGRAAEARPLAERAYRLSGQAAIVADTVGWVHFKLGDAVLAAVYIDRAAAAEKTNVDVLLHAAEVHAELKDLARARACLEAALAVDATLASRPDVAALAARIR